MLVWSEELIRRDIPHLISLCRSYGKKSLSMLSSFDSWLHFELHRWKYNCSSIARPGFSPIDIVKCTAVGNDYLKALWYGEDSLPDLEIPHGRLQKKGEVYHLSYINCTGLPNCLIAPRTNTGTLLKMYNDLETFPSLFRVFWPWDAQRL